MNDVMLRFVHISDTHFSHDPNYNRDYAAYIPAVGTRALVEQLNALPFTPDFVLHTGDVAYDPLPEAYPVARDVLSKIKYPTYYIAGNHDDPAALQTIVMGRDDIATPLHYEVEINGAQIVCVDSNGPAEPPAGFVTDEQLAWLRALCEADDDRPLIVAIHHNVVEVGVPWLDEWMGITNGDAVHQALRPARQRLRGVFFGHVHQNLTIVRDGILYSSVLSSWAQLHAWPGMTRTTPDIGAEPGFNVVTITREQTFIRHHRFAVDV
ncbi:MAG: hypothetical protein D6737_11680 [Chloroflexi bacterium]|nr:MAG: hypothetical protein D6737_11680 [Chloroflexota bacterium]